MTPQSPITELYGISAARAALFAKLDIFTVDDLVNHYPRGYENRGDVKQACDLIPGETASVILEISSPLSDFRVPAKKGRALTVQKVRAHDDTGSVALSFFNQSFLKNTLVTGRKFRFYGQVGGTLLSPHMTSPTYEPYYEGKVLDSHVPIYPLTSGITCNMISKLVKSCIGIYKNIETLPQNILDKYGLCGYYEALYNIHFPENAEKMLAARKRLAFEELLNFQIKLANLKARKKSGGAYRVLTPDMKAFYNSLPFALTDGQKNAVNDILSDLRSDSPARRLIQGDVGSGKTVVAAAAVYAAAKNGLQSALMVPTEILAEQQYASLLPLMEEHRISTALLTGSTKAAEKKRILAALSAGDIDFIIGTHALIEDNVIFKNLALAITDEQHRFGVNQREKLAKKSENEGDILSPHTVVMSATPIPRTLALLLYGDLDISIIDELPPGRQKVDTFAVGESMRERMYGFVRKLTDEGRQVYIVCPLVEQDKEDIFSDEQYKESLKSAVEYCGELKSIFPDISIDFIHGKMKPKEKDEVMGRFARGETQILVSTTVIEVGVNVPNAALMIVENAERFGLSQLHQLRGRVGRGKHKSYCVLISPTISGKVATGESVAERRFRILCENTSGFKISEYDLELRGPGDFFGRRQSGEMSFKIADIAADMEILTQTKSLAEQIVKKKL